MTTIKPPSGPGAGPAAIPTADEAPRTGADFRASLPTTPDRPTARAAEAAEAGPLGPLVEQLQAGSITPAQAVDTLLASALSSPAAATLTAAGKVELERKLRAALANDPSLRAMIQDLERAR